MSESKTVTETTGEYPKIGSILHDFARIAGLKEKQFEPKSSFDRDMQRLSKETDIDLDRYSEFLDMAIARYEELTDHLNHHWLSGAGVFQLFRAYQELILNVPVSVLTQTEIDRFVAFTFLCWSVEGYAKWFRNYPEKTKDYITPFWMKRHSPHSNRFESVITNLKSQLGIPDSTSYALCKLLIANSADHEEIRALQKQITDWEKGQHTPQWQTLEGVLIEKVKKKNTKAAQILRLDILTWFWISHWKEKLEKSGIEMEKLNPIFIERFNRSMNTEQHLPAHIPSSLLWPNELLIFFTSELLQEALTSVISQEEAKIWQAEINNNPFDFLDNVNDLNQEKLLELITSFEYRRGPGFKYLTNEIFKRLGQDNKKVVEKVHKKMYLHGLIQSAYRDSKAWWLLQTKISDGINALITTVDEQYPPWMNHWTSKNINRLYQYGRYTRTRLMVAAAYGDALLVEQLIKSGSNPCMLSKTVNMQSGDQASALLLALQGYQNTLSSDKAERPQALKHYKKVIELLFKTLADAEEEAAAEVVNTGTKIKNVSPFSVAIELGEPDFVEKCIALGADLRKRLGGDDFEPFYLSLNTYFRTTDKLRDTHKIETHFMLGQNMNPLRMTNPYSLLNSEASFEPGTEKWKALQRAQQRAISSIYRQIPDDIGKVLKIIRLLAHPETINKMCSKGRYPLDLAVEINESKLIKLMRETGARKHII